MRWCDFSTCLCTFLLRFLNFLSKSSTMVFVDMSSTTVMRKDVQYQPSALNIVTLLRGYITRIWSQGWSRIEYSSLIICLPASPQQSEFNLANTERINYGCLITAKSCNMAKTSSDQISPRPPTHTPVKSALSANYSICNKPPDVIIYLPSVLD
jgi:hypothetical protein